MSDNANNQPTNQESPLAKNVHTSSETFESKESGNLFNQIKSFIFSWQLKVIITAIALISSLWVIFFWKHIIALQSLKGWANHAQAEAIDCMMQDSNDDKYISCSAKLDNQIVPLECGTSLFNMGCRVNYGSASPSVKLQEKSIAN
ncbi:hypothetical protein [Cyanobacterium aponinum]|uniref:Uncharacterized protein n=1 Tax=Cyanobacterium aponinum 0216 TaxID=2676140 RepID=A0A844GRY9_9CHRO|nr:hypothetical protein [Cyanobacterium aponinum]MTF39247.1 hypothetical protein [Cyanobacterium aponinum 0216]